MDNFQERQIDEGRLFAAIGYIWILCLVPLLLKRDNRFCLFHGKQALVIFIGEVLFGLILIVPVIGWVIGFVASLVFTVLSILGFIQAIMGNFWKIPIVSDIAECIHI